MSRSISTQQHSIAAKSKISFFFPGEKPVAKPKLACEILSNNDSNDPSYTNLSLPYRVICRQRYQKAGVKQRQQFLKEIRKQEMSQSRALNGVRIHREFINPIHIAMNPKEIIRLTPKQQFKLDALLKD